MGIDFNTPSAAKVLAVCFTLVVCGGIASADVEPRIVSTYNMIYRVIGQSYFKIKKNDEPKLEQVQVTLEPTSGERTLVIMRIEREDSGSCGMFSECNWRYATTDCGRVVDPAETSVTCTWPVSVSNERHRLILSKSDDSKRIMGRVTIRKP